MNIHVNHSSKTAIYRQIATQMKHQILSGEIVAGSRLPSERSMALRLGVHRNTVVKAYAELKAEELIRSKQGVGYVVALAEADKAANKGRRVHWGSQIKDGHMEMEVTFDDLFQRFSDENVVSLGSGLASPEVYNKTKVAADIAQVITEEGKSQYFYSPYQGEKNLRQKLVSFLSTKGVKATLGEIQVLTESNQALDFIVTLLLREGDVVLMEEPVSPDAYRTVELAGGRIVTLPVDEDGMCCDKLEEMVLHYKPRFLYVNSSFHDPTGGILSIERRKQIIEVSKRHGLMIIEEDAASELVYGGTKYLPLKAYDTLNNVVYIYSFSLTFMPGLSLAFIVGDKELIRRLSYLVSVRMVATDWLTQTLISKYLEDGSYYSSLDLFREQYLAKQNLVCQKLDEMKSLGVEYSRPKGGVYIWAKLPDCLDSKSLIEICYRNGVAVLPGYVFYPHKNGGRNRIRINYSYEPIEKVEIGMGILRKTIEQEIEKCSKLAHEK